MNNLFPPPLLHPALNCAFPRESRYKVLSFSHRGPSGRLAFVLILSHPPYSHPTYHTFQ